MTHKYESGWHRLDADPTAPLRKVILELVDADQAHKDDIIRRFGKEPHWCQTSKLYRPRKAFNTMIEDWLGLGLGYKRWKITIELE